jgi:hypothetical protein
MTNKRPTPGPSAGKNHRKRAVPTIDLKATEAQPEAAASDPPVQDPAQTPPAHEPRAQKLRASAPPARDPPAEEPLAPKSSEAEPAFAAAANDASGQQRNAPASAMTTVVFAAGIGGALVTSLVLLGLWLTGLLQFGDADTAATRTQVAALEAQIQELQKRPAQVTGTNVYDTKAVDALSERVAKMETAITKIPVSTAAADPALAKRVAENAMKALGVALTALNRRSDDIAANAAQARSRADAAEKAVTDLRAGLTDVSKTVSAGASAAELASLQKRITSLEQSTQAVRAELTKTIASTSAADNAARLALSAAALRDSVLRGAPFADELAQAKSLGADDKILAPLAPFAATGVPSEKALAQELGTLLPGVLKATGASATSGSFIERLQANAEHLVRIRPLDAPPGDDTSAVLARIEIAAAHGDIAAALTDLGKLSDVQRAPAQAWIAKVKNSQAALVAARQLAVDAVRALASR